ncbi:response regulator transcription factor [Bacillus carboniphilus]|uniref:Response regulator transcription factor n=1 Tax=Bacillus carboniphilus TaxID=86663 RepID=A0ABP3FMX2_9BACI
MGNPIKVLLVDDQELIRESLSIVLDMDEDLEVVGIAANGQEALFLCEDLQPDVVLMDIHMPVMDGMAATKEVKEKWPGIKVIILTTFQEINHVVDALTIGAEGYLLKAIHPKDLISGIKLIHHGGTLLPQDLAKLLVQKLQKDEPVKNDKFGLTDRELEVLTSLSQGLGNKQIAERLFLSEGTVKNYISNIYHKLEVKDRFQAAQKAQEEKLI